MPRGIAAAAIAGLRYRILRGAPTKRWVYRLLERRGPFYDVVVHGVKLRCRANDNWTETGALIYGMRRSEEVIRLLDGLKPGDTVVDLGANSGLVSVMCAQAVGPAGKVVAVEPNAVLVERIAANAGYNGFGHVRIAPFAVGAKEETLTLHVVSAQQGRSSLLPVAGGDTPVTVAVRPLTDILAEHGVARIDAMKIDIEGFEDRALVPFFATAPRSLWPRKVLIEVLGRGGSWEHDIIDDMLARGYEVAWQGKLDMLLALPPG